MSSIAPGGPSDTPFGRPSAAQTKRASAADVSYQWVKDRIAELPRDAGVFISEGEVATGSGTGRTPAREALQRLELEGYLQIIPRKGIFVPPVSDDDIVSVLEARRLIEEWSVERVTELGSLSVGELRASLAEQEQLIGQEVAFITSDRLFHRAIVERAGNPILARLYEQLRDRQTRMGIIALAERDRVDQVIDEHRAIVEAIASGDAARARAAVASHIDNTLHTLLGNGRRTTANSAAAKGEQ